MNPGSERKGYHYVKAECVWCLQMNSSKAHVIIEFNIEVYSKEYR